MSDDCFCHGMIPNCRICDGTGKIPCPICGGVGHIQQLIPGTDHEFRIIDCANCLSQSRDRQPRVIGIGEGMENNLLSEMTGPVLSDVAQAIADILRNRSGWLVAYGPYSKGKTYALAAALNALSDYGLKTGRYVQAGMLLSELQAAAIGEHPRGLTLNALESEIINADVVCIDDLNWISDNQDDWKHERFYEVVTSRSEARGYAPTLFATNKPARWFVQNLPWLAARFDRGPVREFDFSVAETKRSKRVVSL